MKYHLVVTYQVDEERADSEGFQKIMKALYTAAPGFEAITAQIQIDQLEERTPHGSTAAPAPTEG